MATESKQQYETLVIDQIHACNGIAQKCPLPKLASTKQEITLQSCVLFTPYQSKFFGHK